MSGGRVFSDQLTLRNIEWFQGVTNPNGVLTAPVGSVYVDNSSTPPFMYRNVNGGTLWVVNQEGPVELTFQPGGVQGGNMFTTWSDMMLVHAFFAAGVPIVVTFSNLFATPVIPAGTYDFTNTLLSGLILGGSTSDTKTLVNVSDGVVFSGARAVRNLDLHRLPGGTAAAIITFAAGTRRLLLDNTSITVDAGAGGPAIEIGGTADGRLWQTSGDIRTLAGGVPVVDVVSAAATLTWQATKANIVSPESIRTVAGSTLEVRILDADSRKVRQTLALGIQTVEGRFPDGGFRVTYAPSNPAPAGFVFDDFDDALNMLQLLPAGVRKELVFDDTFVGPGVQMTIPAAVRTIPARTIFSDGRPAGTEAANRPVIAFTTGSTLASDDGIIRTRNINWRHIGTSLVTPTTNQEFKLVYSQFESRVSATGPMIAITGGNDAAVLCRETIFSKESLASPTIVDVVGGGDVEIILQGRTNWGKDVVSSTGPIGGGSETTVDEEVTIERQRRWRLPSSRTLLGPQANETKRVSRRLTALVRDQLQGTGGVPSLHQAGVYFLADAVLPSVGNTLVLNNDTSAEIYTFVAGAPAAFEITIGATVAAHYVNVIASIVLNSLLYDSVAAYDMDSWTAGTTVPGQAVVVISKTQTEESIAHRLYGTYTTGTPMIVSFESNPMDYSVIGSTALPATDPGDQIGFGWGSSFGMQNAITLSVLEQHLTFCTRTGAALDVDLWQRMTGGNDGLNTVTALGANAIGRLTTAIIVDLTAAGAGASALNLPSTTLAPKNTMIMVRRRDSNGAATATLTPAAGETVNATPGLLVAVTSGVAIWHEGGTDWNSIP